MADEFVEKGTSLVTEKFSGFNVPLNTFLNIKKPSNLAIQGAGIAVVRGQIFQTPSQDPIQKESQQQFDIPELQQQEFERVSMLGTPVISNLEIKAGAYKDLDGNVITYEGIRIDSVIFTVGMVKNIVTTPVVGRNGTVKEYISDGDFDITADIVIVGETKETSPDILEIESIGNRIPERDITRLFKILQVPEQVEIRSDFLDFFEIGNIVVSSFTTPQRAGHTNSQVFTINMLSDEPIELQ